jgi:hypothetical protein
LLVQRVKDLLNAFHLRLLKIDFTALDAYPGGDSVNSEVVTLPINIEWDNPSFHLSLAVHASHRRFLFWKSYSHSSRLGKYAVIIARQSP